MAKRARIVMLISMLCLCVSLLVVGVFAVSTITFNVSSSLNYQIEKPVAVPEYFTYRNNTITGLSNDYTSLETKPETLVIPSTDLNGNKITSITSGTSSTATFKDIQSSKVIIEEGITSIGSYAFRNCTSLTSVSLPSSLTSVGYSSFQGCTNLNSMDYLGTLEQWCTISFANDYSNPTFYSKALNIDGVDMANLEIPEGVETIEDYCFYCCENIKSLTLPNSLKNIGKSAFDSCRGLTSLNLPEGIETLGEAAFSACTYIKSIILPKSLKNVGSLAFNGFTSLNTVNYSGTLAQWCSINFMGDYSSPTAYAKELYINGEKIVDLVISEEIEKIGDYAFQRYTALKSVTLQSGVKIIGNNAFSICSNLKSANILSDLEEIEEEAFYLCRNLDITLPSSLKIIQGDAFYSCTINSMNYLGSIEQWCAIDFGDQDSNPASITRALCINGETVTNLVVPEGVETIGEYAFYYCKNLISISIPSSVTSIGSSTFAGCSSSQITVASDNANYSSHEGSLYNKAQTELIRCVGGVSTITILDTVTSIGDYAFSSCSSLTNIEIPSRVTSIGYWAFSSCTNLTTLTINTQAGYVWQKASNSSFTSNLSTVDVSDPTQNATWFKGTPGYHNYYWRQIEESAA